MWQILSASLFRVVYARKVMAVKQFDVIQQLTADGPNHNYDLDFILFYMAQSSFSKAHKSDNKSLSYVHTYYSVNMMVNGLLANHLHNRHYWQFAEQCMTQIALQNQINLQ